MKSKYSLDEQLEKLSVPARHRVRAIAKAITAACAKAEFDEDYPSPRQLSEALGFPVTPLELKIAECVQRRRSHLATTLH